MAAPTHDPARFAPGTGTSTPAEANGATTNGQAAPEALTPAPAKLRLPSFDVRRKRPPVLSFLLRWDSVRRLFRLTTLLTMDFFAVLFAIFTALAVKGAWHNNYDAHAAVRGDQGHPRLLLPRHRAAVRALRPLLRQERPPGADQDRRVALPGDAARVRLHDRHRPERPVLELLHLLRVALLRGPLHLGRPLPLRQHHRLRPARRRLRAPCRARRDRPPHRGGRARAGRRHVDGHRRGRLHLAHAAPGQRPAVAR